MYPRPKVAGLAGIIAGAALAVELGLFMVSGWTPDTFSEPASALLFLEAGGPLLRAAVLVGMIGFALTIIFIVGLADRLRIDTPTRATATLYFGILGIAGHALVPLSLWVGVPGFLELAAHDADAARSSWGAFNILLDGAQGVGGLFLGLSMLAAGSAIVSRRSLSAVAGWIGIGAGAATMLTLFAVDTPLTGLAMAAFMPALALTIAFRIKAGHEIRRAEPIAD